MSLWPTEEGRPAQGQAHRSPQAGVQAPEAPGIRQTCLGVLGSGGVAGLTPPAGGPAAPGQVTLREEGFRQTSHVILPLRRLHEQRTT